MVFEWLIKDELVVWGCFFLSSALALCGLCDMCGAIYEVRGLCMACVGCVWVYHVCALCVRNVGVDASASYMHYVSVGELVVGFGCEGYCSGFESGNNMATKCDCMAG